MSILDFLRREKPAKKTGRRAFSAGDVGRLTASWTTVPTSADTDARYTLATLRARARELEQNNDYAKRYIKLVSINLVGPAGMAFQSRVKDPGGNPDALANKIIETAWADWTRTAGFDGKSWLECQTLFAETVARDGEVLVLFIRGKAAGNKYNFSVKFLEADHLDEQYNNAESNVYMGIQYDAAGRVAKYHVWERHPGDDTSLRLLNVRRHINAGDMIHAFYQSRPSQSRGVPWMHSAMTRLKGLGAYEEAEITAARVAASQMGLLVTPDGDYEGDRDADNSPMIDAEPGTFPMLPPGYDMKMFDPKHPGGNTEPFIRTTLRGISAGLDVSYGALSGDLSDANYSSQRIGALYERDNWMTKQAWMIKVFCAPVFRAWLDMFLLSGLSNLPYSKFDKFNAPDFKARRWPWVDPQKDIEASVIGINNKLKTRADVAAEQGKDFEEIIDQLSREKQYAESKGIDLSEVQNANIKNANIQP